MLMLASSSSSPRHRGSIERGVDGGCHRVIGGRAGEMCSNRLQEMIALSDRQRRRRPHSLKLAVSEARGRVIEPPPCIDAAALAAAPPSI
jgi:hypothetical protein